jgi:hypothetical protein
LPLAKKQQNEAMAAGYREMAENTQAERDALDWCEARISDCVVADDVEPEVRRDPKLK